MLLKAEEELIIDEDFIIEEDDETSEHSRLFIIRYYTHRLYHRPGFDSC